MCKFGIEFIVIILIFKALNYIIYIFGKLGILLKFFTKTIMMRFDYKTVFSHSSGISKVITFFSSVKFFGADN